MATEFLQPGNAKYTGDRTGDIIGQVMGPTLVGNGDQYVRAVEATYDPGTDRTIVKFVNHVDGSYSKE